MHIWVSFFRIANLVERKKKQRRIYELKKTISLQKDSSKWE